MAAMFMTRCSMSEITRDVQGSSLVPVQDHCSKKDELKQTLVRVLRKANSKHVDRGTPLWKQCGGS